MIIKPITTGILRDRVVAPIFGPAGGNSLENITTDLKAWWAMEESTSVTRVNATGDTVLNLAAGIYPTDVEGAVNRGDHYNGSYLTTTTGTTGVNAAGGDWTVVGWIKPDSFSPVTGTPDPVCLTYGNVGSTAESSFNWTVGVRPTGTSAYVKAYVPSAGLPEILTWSSALSTGTLYFLVAQYDSTNNKLGLSVDDAPMQYLTLSDTPLNNTGTGNGLRAGAWTSIRGEYVGMMDEFAVFNRLLSSAERTALSAGVTYSDL